MLRAQIAFGLASLLLASTALAQPTQVETGTGTATIIVTLPGTAAGSGFDFGYGVSITSLDFTPGSVTFQGQPVDFDGTEASFLASSYTGTANIPVTTGPASVTATGSLTPSGAVDSGAAVNGGLNLGAGFSSNFLDVQLGSGNYSGTTAWQSSVIPELNGANVTTAGDHNVLNVDPVAGIIDVSYSFQIDAIQHADNPVPVATRWGLALLVLGLVTIGVLWSRRPRALA